MSELRAVIVPRVSTQQQATEGTSIEGQEAACLRWARANGAEVVATYRDDGVSGALYLTRTGMQQALADIESGRANVLITAKLDRAGRDVEALRDIRRRVHDAGAQLVFADGLTFQHDATGNLMYTQLAAFAEFERDVIRDRTMAGSRRLAEKGVQPVRAMHPYGYRIVTERQVIAGEALAGTQGSYIIVPDEAAIVAAMFSDYASGSVSAHALARRLNDAEVPTPRGGQAWSPQTIVGILRNPVYRGTATWGRHERRVDERRKAEKGLQHAHYRRVRSTPTVLIPVPPITDGATWQECQTRLDNNKRAKGGRPDRLYLLSAIARCPVCGRGLSGKTESTTKRRLYRCNRDSMVRHLPLTTWRADELEEMTVRAIHEAAQRPELLEAAALAVEEDCARQASATDVAALKAKLTALQRRESVAVSAQVDALIAGRDAAPYVAMLADLGARLRDLADQIRHAEGETRVTVHSDVTKPQTRGTTDALDALWRVLTTTHLTIAEKRDAVQGFVAEVIPLDKEGVEIVLRSAPGSDQKNKNTHQFFMRLP